MEKQDSPKSSGCFGSLADFIGKSLAIGLGLVILAPLSGNRSSGQWAACLLSKTRLNQQMPSSPSAAAKTASLKQRASIEEKYASHRHPHRDRRISARMECQLLHPAGGRSRASGHPHGCDHRYRRSRLPAHLMRPVSYAT